MHVNWLGAVATSIGDGRGGSKLGFHIQLPTGYSGSERTIGLRVNNKALGDGTSPNIGVEAITTSAGKPAIGLSGFANSGSIRVGVYGGLSGPAGVPIKSSAFYATPGGTGAALWIGVNNSGVVSSTIKSSGTIILGDELGSATPNALGALQGEPGLGTDIAGADISISGGLGTGASVPSRIKFLASKPIASGATAQTNAEVMSVGDAKADGTTNFVTVAGTIPTVPTAAIDGVKITITSAGSAAFNQVALASLLAAGYTGPNSTIVDRSVNSSQGTAVAFYGNSLTLLGNVGKSGQASGVGAGSNIGLYGLAFNSTGYNAAVFGRADGGANAIGIFGQAVGNATNNVGVYATFSNTTIQPLINSALLVDNNAQPTFPIATFRQAGALVFSIEAGGGIRVKHDALGSTTLDNTEHIITVDATAGAKTLTLPVIAAGNRGIWYRIKKIDASANTVTIAAGAGNTVDGAATQVLSFQYQSVDVFCPSAGTDWLTFGASTGISGGSSVVDDEARAMAFMAL